MLPFSKAVLVFLALQSFIFEANGATITIYENIFINNKMQVSPEQVCHDGLYLYYRDLNSCLTDSSYQSDCEREDLRISPLRSVERLFAYPGSDYITRFYEVNLDYFYSEHEVTDLENKESKIIAEGTKRVPYCKGRPKFEPRNIGKNKVAESDFEKKIVLALLAADVSLVNFPLESLENLKRILFDKSTSGEVIESQIKSPLCNANIDPDSVILLSGEISGNGFSGFNTSLMQNISENLYFKITEKRNSDNSGSEESIEFSCKNEWDI